LSEQIIPVSDGFCYQNPSSCLICILLQVTSGLFLLLQFNPLKQPKLDVLVLGCYNAFCYMVSY